MPIHSELRLRLDAEYGPEAPVRRAWVERLISHYHYPSRHIDIEVVARAGRETSVRADIVVYRDRERHKPLIVVETKAPGNTAEVARGADQAESYARLLGAAYFVSTNGRNTLYFRTSLRSRIPVSDIPYRLGLVRRAIGAASRLAVIVVLGFVGLLTLAGVLIWRGVSHVGTTTINRVPVATATRATVPLIRYRRRKSRRQFPRLGDGSDCGT